MATSLEQDIGIIEWDQCMRTHNFLVDSFIKTDATNLNNSFSKVNRRRKLFKVWFLIIYNFVQFLHYFLLFFLKEESPEMTKALTGAMFHSIGFSGRIIGLGPAWIFAQTSLMRLTIHLMEKTQRLVFLKDLIELRMLSKEEKTNFKKMIHLIYQLTITARFSCLIFAWTVCFFVSFMSIRLDAPVYITVIWVIHSLLIFSCAYVGCIDFFIQQGFWYIGRTHIESCMDSLLNKTRKLLLLTKGTRNDIDSWMESYNMFQEIEGNFDSFSKYFVLIVASTSSLANAAFLFGALLSEGILGIAFFFVFVTVTVQSMLFLWGTTVIHTKGKKLHDLVNRVYLKFQYIMSPRQKHVIRQVIQDLGDKRYPSVTLTLLGGTPYDASAFGKYVIGFVAKFIILIDFLKETIKESQ